MIDKNEIQNFEIFKKMSKSVRSHAKQLKLLPICCSLKQALKYKIFEKLEMLNSFEIQYSEKN